MCLTTTLHILCKFYEPSLAMDSLFDKDRNNTRMWTATYVLVSLPWSFTFSLRTQVSEDPNQPMMHPIPHPHERGIELIETEPTKKR